MKVLIFLFSLSMVLIVTNVYATFSQPVPVAIDTDRAASAVSISKDELTIFFYSNTVSSQYDIFYSTRPNKNSSFGTPIPLSIVNTPQMETGPDISSDGLSLYFSRGESWELDAYICTRLSTLDPFGIPSPITELNTEYREIGLNISDDGLELFFVSTRLPDGNHHLFSATRANTNLPFENIAPISELNTVQNELNPSITTDGLTLYYVFRNGPDGYPQEIWSASRQDKYSPFGSAHEIEELNITGLSSSGSDISYDGNTIYFVSERPGSLLGNLWMATIIPEPTTIIIAAMALVIGRVLRKK